MTPEGSTPSEHTRHIPEASFKALFNSHYCALYLQQVKVHASHHENIKLQASDTDDHDVMSVRRWSNGYGQLY
mgnify:CR=1 FL=1